MANAAIDIPNLIYRYANAIDAADFDGAAAMFDHGHVVANGHEIKGAENIKTMWESWIRLYPDGTPRTRHIITNPIIELSDDATTATCHAQWTVLQATDELPLQPIATGRYRDRFAIIGGAWSYTEKEYLQTDLVGNTSGHTKQPIKERA
ncbi:nuclear transport factor 2 family protein [Parasphingorhabdus halotolerans]|uniref:SnoaL-like domain-containing protein n=1 Tax=Parasphingorhabdus halotolerans TaxID=2725558 RepID=A0A6H2DKZ9_9SPHN|nr:nuclear transport factor 2 family protein [Parasphingorhabdus halotolerans]QJB68817.1 SnoaL-like domain-containing protein [Parasphingorhabdus halotolerans]